MDKISAIEINKIFLESITESLPQFIFWKDIDSVYLGCNKNFADFVGLKTPHDIIGKKDQDLNWQSAGHTTEAFRKGDVETLSGKPVTNQEEKLVLPNGKTLITLVSKLPIVYDGKAIGIVGYFTDITEIRKTELQAKLALEEAITLKLENAAHIAKLEAQEQISKNANQVAHDIRSPLSTLLILLKSCNDIPETTRIAIREAAVSIGDIANNLLSKYKTKECDEKGYTEERTPLLLSATLLHSISDKKYQYTDLPVKFEHKLSPSSHFAFIRIGPSSFKRMISNIINNAVDAFEKREGKVTIKLDVTSKIAKISIEDNGKGMPQQVVEKILQNIEVTAAKAEGHGIGLTQVRETLMRNQGKISINSQINYGTQIILEFPRIKAPEWIVEEIKIGKEDIVVILDDDSSIHLAWDIRFEPILKKYPGIQVHHFENGQEAIEFIKGLTEVEKQRVNLLTDYELLKQELNGLHVIEKTKIKRSILVTSHYADHIVLERSRKMKTKILPKQLASEVLMIIDETKTFTPGASIKTCPREGRDRRGELKESFISGLSPAEVRRKVNAILVDDDERFADTLIQYIFIDDEVDYFDDPHEFMVKIKHYPKDTRIYLDNNYKSGDVNGFSLAKELHELGYTRLYLLTGDTFETSKIPHYLKIIRKDDVDSIKDW